MRRDGPRGAPASFRRDRFREPRPLAAELHPALRAIAVNLNRRLHPARIVERAGADDAHARQHLALVDHRRSAFRAEAPVDRLAAVAATVEGLERSGNPQRLTQKRDRHPKRRAAALLAVSAMTDANEDRLRLGRITHPPA